MAEAGERKRRGRPPMDPEVARRHQQSFRIREAQRALLQSAAAYNGRSLSEEVEARIEQSFSKEEFVIELLGGETLFSVFLSVSAQIKKSCKNTEWEKHAIDDEVFFKSVVGFFAEQFHDSAANSLPLSHAEAKTTRERRPKRPPTDGAQLTGPEGFADK